MLLFTHSIGPVIIKQLTELRHPERYDCRTQLIGWLTIGIAGMLPDLLSPHITTGGRYDAFSHTWAFTCVFLALCCLSFVIFFKKPYRNLPVWCGAAYLLHLFEDIISGGIDFLSTGNVIGDYYVSPEYWMFIDLIMLTTAFLLYRKIKKHSLRVENSKIGLDRRGTE